MLHGCLSMQRQEPLFEDASFSSSRSPAFGNAPCVIGTGTALPKHHYTQQQLAEVALRTLPELRLQAKVVERFFGRVGVEGRYLALPAGEYAKLDSFGARNDAWIVAAMDLAEECVNAALADANLTAGDIQLFMSTSVTGLSVPSLEARLMNRLPFARELKRVPMFGLGCLAGAAGVARVSEYLRAFPSHCAILLSVELCSLTVQKGDGSVANMISSGLFGDGAAAVVVAGSEHLASAKAGPRVLGSRSLFFPDTERVMGWDIIDTGFKIVLSEKVPQIAREGVPVVVDALLAEHRLSRADVKAWIVHPGGPAVMEGMRKGLELESEQLEATRTSLAEVGNLSSASVLFLLDHYRKTVRPSPGSYGMMIAMGPAFCAEAVLVQW